MFDNYSVVNSDFSPLRHEDPVLDLSTPVMQSVDVPRNQLSRLAAEVRARRISLGLAQGDLAGRGGPGVVTVGKIERSEIANPEPSTLRKIDRALMWAEGSAAQVLAGGEPTPIAGEQPGSGIVAAIERETALIPEARAHLINQLGLLLRITPPAEPPPLKSVTSAEHEDQLAVTTDMQARIESRKRSSTRPPAGKTATTKRPK